MNVATNSNSIPPLWWNFHASDIISFLRYILYKNSSFRDLVAGLMWHFSPSLPTKDWYCSRMRILTLTKLPCLFAEQLILNSSWDLPYRDYLDSLGLALHLILLTLYLVQEMSHSMNPFLWSLYFQHCIDTIPVNHCFFNKEFYYSTVTVAAYTCQVKRLHCMVKKKKKKKP